MKKATLFFAVFLMGSVLWAQDRGLSLQMAAGLNSAVGRQWAVFIAIDRYQEWGPLSNPVRDAREIRDILLEYYYIDEVRELYDRDATAAGIRQLFVDLRDQVGRDDSVFVFYAGHGYTDPYTNTGSWIPVNGGRDTLAQSNWLPNIQVRNLLAQLPAKHVFLISDSCFSGDLLDTNRGASPQIDSNYYRQVYGRVSRQVMTSGASESVPDSSEFAMRLKSGLRRAEGACIDPEYLFTRAGVREVQSTQPMLGTIRGSEHQEGGSFLFFRKDAAGVTTLPTPVPSTTQPIQPVNPAPAPNVTPSPNPAPRPSPAPTSYQDEWKNKWVYLGGGFGFGTYSYSYDNYYDNYYSSYSETRTNTDMLFAGGVVADFALFNFLSIGVDLAIAVGDEVIPVVPILAKLGYKFSQVDLSFNIGYTIGAGFTIGGTVGYHIGPGILFAEMIGIPDASPSDGILLDSAFLGIFGYKFGLGNK